MPTRCARCTRSLAAMPHYRSRGETFRPGSIMPSTPRALRGRGSLCSECWRELPPDVKHAYAREEQGARFGRGY